jgi:hypothetical protein
VFSVPGFLCVLCATSAISAVQALSCHLLRRLLSSKRITLPQKVEIRSQRYGLSYTVQGVDSSYLFPLI